MPLSTAEEVLGRQRKKIQSLVTNSILDLCEQRWQLKQQKYTSAEAGLEYRKVSREVRKMMKSAKEEWIEEQCKNIDKGMMAGKQQGDLQHPQGSDQDPNSISHQSSETAAGTP